MPGLTDAHVHLRDPSELLSYLELAELVTAGLTQYDARATGTRNPGGFIGKHVRASPPFGTVTEGSRADLLLLSANPLSDISDAAQIRGVVVRGQWYARSQIDTMRIIHASSVPSASSAITPAEGLLGLAGRRIEAAAASGRGVKTGP